MGLPGVEKPYAPWFWGPRNPKLADPDRSNGEVVDYAEPGDVVASGRQNWEATLAGTNDIDIVELMVNGVVVEKLAEIKAGETRTYQGQVILPEGGWVAIRAYSSEIKEDTWPSMHARPFAHSSPIWINSIGSTDPTSRKAAAADLIRAIDASEKIARTAYGEIEIPG